MEIIENNNVAAQTEAPSSRWIGPAMSNPIEEQQTPRLPGEQVPHDTFTWTDRLFSVFDSYGPEEGFELGPTAGASYGSVALHFPLTRIDMFAKLLDKFYSFSYESISVRFSLSDPKGLVGGIHVGWWPYQDIFDKAPQQSMAAWMSSDLLSQAFANSPHTQFMGFGSSQDVTMSIPWTYKFSSYPCKWVLDQNESTQNGRPPYGTPLIWFQNLASFFVSSVSKNARLQIFLKYEGMKWYGPMAHTSLGAGNVRTKLQMMAGAATTTAATAVVEAASSAVIAAGVGALSAAVEGFVGSDSTSDRPMAETAQSGTYDAPQAMQLAFLGDTTSCDYPSTTPIFQPPLSMIDYPQPTIHELLSRPQYIGHFTTTNGYQMSNDPMSFGHSIHSTYFRYFGMLNRYWRGTINAHFIVTGHPLVETLFRVRVSYPGSVITASQTFMDYTIHKEVFSGSKQIIVPMPFLTPNDYLPVQDKLPFNGFGRSTCSLTVDVDVVSTSLDISPVIPIFVYVSAAPDFKFYQPYPPGLYNVQTNDLLDKVEAEKARRKERVRRSGPVQPGDEGFLSDELFKQSTRLQVGFPAIPLTVAETRAEITKDPGLLPSFDQFTDYMKIWGRIVPFEDYNHDEEIVPNPSVGLTCATWFPPIDRAQTLDANNSWYQSLDYIAYFSMLFCLYRGSMGFKIVATTAERTVEGGYLFVTLSDTDLSLRQKTRTPHEFNPSQLTGDSNLGSGTVVTPILDQPVLELTVPYRGVNIWSDTIWNAHGRGVARLDTYPNATVAQNIELLRGNVFADTMFRKIDSDFVFAVETCLPPPTMWASRGFDWA